MIISGLMFPVIQSWTEGDGFLAAKHYIDNTNASGTYMVGGLVGFVGNTILGPRYSLHKSYLSKLANYPRKLRKL